MFSDDWEDDSSDFDRKLRRISIAKDTVLITKRFTIDVAPSGA